MDFFKTAVDNLIVISNKFKKLFSYQFKQSQIKNFSKIFIKRVRKFFFRRSSKNFKWRKWLYLRYKLENFLNYFDLDFFNDKSLRVQSLYWVICYYVNHFRKSFVSFFLKTVSSSFEVAIDSESNYPGKFSYFFDDKEFKIYADEFIDYMDYREFFADKKYFKKFKKHDYKYLKEYRPFQKFLKNNSLGRYFVKFYKNFWYKDYYRNFRDFKYSVSYKYYVEFKSWDLIKNFYNLS